MIGHSERREYHAESDELVNAKVKNALGAGLKPILCVGEKLEVRKAGEHVPVTLGQLDGGLAGLTAEQVRDVVVAYEPVWAIGTGETATPEDAQELCEAIRVRIAELYDQDTADAVRVLYGGSVKSSNVASIMTKPDVDGALIGGASLTPRSSPRSCATSRTPSVSDALPGVGARRTGRPRRGEGVARRAIRRLPCTPARASSRGCEPAR